MVPCSNVPALSSQGLVYNAGLNEWQDAAGNRYSCTGQLTYKVPVPTINYTRIDREADSREEWNQYNDQDLNDITGFITQTKCEPATRIRDELYLNNERWVKDRTQNIRNV